MDTRVSYTIVGAFVLVVTVAMLIIGVWLSVGLNQADYNTYVTYMKESVSGLSKNAPVKYNGVEVGFVYSIRLRHENPEEVRISLRILENTPINQYTRAVLETQGVTGIAYIELKGGKLGSPALEKQPGQKYPEIPSAPSLMFRLDNAIEKLTHNINEISVGITNVLSPENTEALSNTLQNLDKFTSMLEENNQKLGNIIEHTDTAMDNISKASHDFPQVMQNIESTASSIQTMSKKLSVASEKLNKTLDGTEFIVQTVNNELLPQTITAVSGFNSVIQNLEGVSRNLEDNPSILIRGQSPGTLGPGEG